MLGEITKFGKNGRKISGHKVLYKTGLTNKLNIILKLRDLKICQHSSFLITDEIVFTINKNRIFNVEKIEYSQILDTRL